MAYVDKLLPDRDKRLNTAERTVSRLIDERDAVLRAHYAGAVPLDQLKTEQERIAAELATAQRQLDERRLDRQQLEKALSAALDLVTNAQAAYAASGPQARRAMNQAVFARIFIADDEIADAQLTDLFERLLDARLKDRLNDELISRDGAAQFGGTMPRKPKSSNLYPSHQDTSSNFRTLVAGTGFEPATSGL
ncbi:hypothetical protein MAUB_16220 [Mycolicibacterium aubagnense]|uniref:Recombinase n=1 Tax=Mycolicibacterium aubagnense TaxID=319707 RepID=A0ABM7IAM1_9MYCO|nr:hypothetical protein MAUB_16220 [Mycolicibacterium aubagnense]